jgi:hypothetical protein
MASWLKERTCFRSWATFWTLTYRLLPKACTDLLQVSLAAAAVVGGLLLLLLLLLLGSWDSWALAWEEKAVEVLKQELKMQQGIFTPAAKGEAKAAAGASSSSLCVRACLSRRGLQHMFRSMLLLVLVLLLVLGISTGGSP